MKKHDLNFDPAYFGNENQLFRVFPFTFGEGKAAGLKCFLVDNGVVELVVKQDRCLDVLSARFKGTNLSFLSKNGAISNDYVHTSAFDFPRSFEGGFLYTCGLDNISASDRGKVVHGSISSTPAERVCCEILGRGNDARLRLSGRMRSTALFGENLTLERTWEVPFASGEFSLRDQLTNESFTAQEYILLYHVNLGYPMLDEGVKIEADVESTETVSDAFDLERMFRMDAPSAGRPEEVYIHRLKENSVRVVNEKRRLAFSLSFSGALPYLIEWKSMASGDYALGLEPASSRFFEHKKFSKLEPGESVEFGLNFRIEEL